MSGDGGCERLGQEIVEKAVNCPDICLASERIVALTMLGQSLAALMSLIKPVPYSPYSDAAQERRKQLSRSPLLLPAAAAQVIVRFRTVVVAAIQGLHTPVASGLDGRSPQGLNGVAVRVIRPSPSPPVCLSLVGTDQPLHFRAHHGCNCPQTLSICPSMPRHLHSQQARLP